jgi:Fe-S-cluster containining protein
MIMAGPVRLVYCDIDGDTGLDVEVTDPIATVADLLAAMQSPADDKEVYKPLHKARYGVCAGCTYNCCKSNDIPLDLVAARSIATNLGMPFERFLRSHLRYDESLTFPEFRRRPCPFLAGNLCKVYAHRALICRLYLCTPMSDRLEKLRLAVLLMGNGALRQTMVDLQMAPRTWGERHLRHAAASSARREWDEDMLERMLHTNSYLLGAQHHEVLLRDCCPDTLWHILL